MSPDLRAGKPGPYKENMEDNTMEVNDWSPAGKDSFTTPGGAFAPPPAGGGRTYDYEIASSPCPGETLRPAARAGEPARSAPQAAQTVRPAIRPQTGAGRETSPFARGAGTAKPWYAEVQAQTQGASAANPAQAAHTAAQAQAAPAVLLNQNGETETVIPLQTTPGGPQVYTVQLPPVPRQPASKRQSLWWVPLLVILALLIGLMLGFLAYPLLNETSASEPPATQSPVPGNEGTAAARVYRENVEAVVSVVVASPQNAGASSVATGFLISSDGFLLTNAHVISSGGSVMVTLSDGRQLPAQVLATEEVQSDLALLKIEATGLHTVVLGDSDTVQVGDPVFTIGNPLGDFSSSLSAGYLSARPREINTGSATYTMLQTNAAINKGNSGGPLFDAAGRVVGMVTAKISATTSDNTVEGLGFALPIDELLDTVNAWLSAARSA